MLELGIINHLVPIQVRNIFIFFLFNFGVYLHKYKFQLYQFKLVHCGVVVKTRALRSYPLFHMCMGGIASVLSAPDDYRKVKELLMLGDSSSKGTISVRFGFC